MAIVANSTLMNTLLIEVKESGKQLSGQKAFQAEGAVNSQPSGNRISVSRDQPGAKCGRSHATRGRAAGDKIRAIKRGQILRTLPAIGRTLAITLDALGSH